MSLLVGLMASSADSLQSARCASLGHESGGQAGQIGCPWKFPFLVIILQVVTHHARLLAFSVTRGLDSLLSSAAACTSSISPDLHVPPGHQHQASTFLCFNTVQSRRVLSLASAQFPRRPVR